MLIERLPSAQSACTDGPWGLLIPILSLFAVSCATGPDFVRPVPPVAPNWTDRTANESQVVTGEPADYGRWWGALDDRALDQLVNESNNLQDSLTRWPDSSLVTLGQTPVLAEETYREGIYVLNNVLEILRQSIPQTRND